MDTGVVVVGRGEVDTGGHGGKARGHFRETRCYEGIGEEKTGKQGEEEIHWRLKNKFLDSRGEVK